MATSVGQINFGVGIDASGIAAELNRALTPALAIVQRKLNEKPLHVPIEIDTAAAIAAARTALGKANLKIDVKLDLEITPAQKAEIRELKSLSNKTVKFNVKLDLKITAAQRAAIQEIKNLSDKTVNARFNVDLTAEQIKQMREAGNAIRRLESKDIRVNLALNLSAEELKRIRDAASAIRRLESKDILVRFDINLSEAEVASLRSAASAIRRLESKNIVIRVDIQADEARLRALAEVLRGLRDRNLRVGVNVDRGPVDNLLHSLGRLTKYTAIGAGITAGLAAIVGAAGAAAGAVGGLVLGLAALGPALAAIGATAAVGFHGIGDAFKAMGEQTANAAADAQARSDAISSASDGVTSALDAQESAQQSLASAQESAADAAKAVGDAYKTAQERLDSYSQSLRESTLDQAEAELDLAEARKKLATGKFTDPLDRQRAVLAVERAEINLQKAQKAGSKLQEEANDAQAKGIDQADEVVAARKNQAKADQEVANAQKGLQRSNEAVAKAYEQLAKAQSGAGGSADKFSEALAKLAPNAQAFVLAWKDLSPAVKDFQQGVQNTLFAGLGDQLKETANTILPAMKVGMQGVAGELNAMATNAFEFLRSEQGMRGLNAAFESGTNLLHGLRSGTGEFTQGLVDLTATAAPHMEAIGKAIAGIGEGIGKAFSDAAASGQLDRLFDGFTVALEGLKPFMDGFVSALITMGEKILPTLGPLFETLGNVLKDIAPSLGDIGAVFANSLTAILPSLGDLIKALAEGLKPVLPVISLLLKAIADAIIPLVPVFSRITTIIGETLVSTIQALAPALEPLATAFADLLQAVAPLIPMLATELATVIQALAPALSEVFVALAPVIKIFAEEMTPVIKQLAPILAQVAMTIGQALADALIQLAPLLPPLITAWSNLILAIAPLLPQLVDLAVQFLPPLVQILVDLAPYLIQMIDLFTWLVNNVIIPFVIPALLHLVDTWREGFDAIADTVHWFTDTLIPTFGSAFDSLKKSFGDVVDWVGLKWAELKGLIAIPINFVIENGLNNGLFKAWGAIDNLLGGVLPDVSPIPSIPTHATGGAIGLRGGAGNGTKDDLLSWLSNGEHVVTAAEVLKAGGQNILYAIRDMIARGIPFTWDNGRIITDLGRDNLSAYGAKVKTAGLGNVAPEGLFDSLARVPVPQFASGGAIFPWMYQLQKGHEFAKAQNGKPYQWAGPRFVGDSFDCSGFMAAIAASILGDNPWQRYWATASFNGQQVGPQGFTKNLTEGSGFGIGVSNGGPGGGHTAGELRGIPELSIGPARVESGGALGDVHYGRGTDPNSFQMQYGLPIGANGFFQPSPGGSANGPSPADQQSFLNRTIASMIKAATDPVRDLIKTRIGPPPPLLRAIPPSYLDHLQPLFADAAGHAVSNLGALLGGAWQRAKDFGGGVLDVGKGLLDSLNPFDSGGIASGTGILTKNTIEPERILSPEQTALFEALVQALTKIASAGLSAASQAAQTVTVDLSRASVDALRLSTGVDSRKVDQTAVDTKFQEMVAQIHLSEDRTVQLISDTAAQTQRTQTSTAEAEQAVADEQTRQLLDIANRLSVDVLGPILSAAVGAGTDFLTGVIEGLSKDVVGAVNGTTKAVNNVSETIVENGGTNAATPAFGQPGSSFDAVSAVSDAVQTVANAATSAFNKVRDDIVAAALKQTRSKAGESKGLLGKDIDGGFLVNLIVQLTGVEIEVRDLLENTLDQITAFREGSFNGFDQNGELISDTAALVQRTASSMELAAAEQERIQKALIKAVIKYLIVNVLIPIITAILGAMITLATTAIGAAIGSAIPIIGTAIGAAVGAAVGAALAGLAAVFTSLLAVGAGAAIDAFDEGGIAPGVGYMPKNTIAPERVLSPRQTAAFETLVQVLDRGGSNGGNRSVNVGSMTVNGTGAADKSADRLLALLNT